MNKLTLNYFVVAPIGPELKVLIRHETHALIGNRYGQIGASVSFPIRARSVNFCTGI